MAVLTTVGLQESIRRGWPRVWLAYFDHPDGEVWLWTGVGDLVYAGQTYEGIGQFGGIAGVGGSKQLGVRQITFELRGIPADAAQWLGADVRGQTARAWVAGLNAAGTQVNGAAWQAVDGKADYQELPIQDDGTIAVQLRVVEPVFEMERSQNLRWTAQRLKETHGSELTGLDLISSLADASENWTRT